MSALSLRYEQAVRLIALLPDGESNGSGIAATSTHKDIFNDLLSKCWEFIGSTIVFVAGWSMVTQALTKISQRHLQ